MRTKHRNGRYKWFLIRYGQSEQNNFVRIKTPSKNKQKKKERKQNVFPSDTRVNMVYPACLRRLGTLDRSAAIIIYLFIYLFIYSLGTTLMNICLFSCTQDPLWKGIYSVRKEFAPTGSKFFPYRVDPLSEGQFPWKCISSPESAKK